MSFKETTFTTDEENLNKITNMYVKIKSNIRNSVGDIKESEKESFLKKYEITDYIKNVEGIIKDNNEKYQMLTNLNGVLSKYTKSKHVIGIYRLLKEKTPGIVTRTNLLGDSNLKEEYTALFNFAEKYKDSLHKMPTNQMVLNYSQKKLQKQK